MVLTFGRDCNIKIICTYRRKSFAVVQNIAVSKFEKQFDIV